MTMENLLQYLMMFPLLVRSNAPLCSQYCKCSLQLGLRNAICTGQRLANIDSGVPTNVQILDLSNNSISTLENRGFKAIGLTALYSLQLQRNHIGNIDLHAFEGVTDLRVLDLSYNHLYYIQPATFEDTPQLRSLYLQGNRLKISYGPILIIPTLQILDLSNCQLDHLRHESFVKLSALLSLNLGHNQLIGLDTEILEPLQDLKKLQLERNPWSCDGKANELEAWLNNFNIRHEPICEKQKYSDEDKFERMISLVEPENETDAEIISDEELLQIWYQSDRNQNGNLQESINSTICQQETSKKDNIFEIFDKIPSFWSLLIGFEIGAVFGGVCIWILLTMNKIRPLSPRPYSTIRRLSNRASFIRLRSVGEESNVLWTELDTLNCPETPPPPYRDVFNTFPRNANATLT